MRDSRCRNFSITLAPQRAKRNLNVLFAEQGGQLREHGTRRRSS
jgi:hypothetical protein